MRVAEYCPADRARRPGPRLQSRAPVIDGPADQPVDGHGGIRPNAVAAIERHLAAARTDDQPADAAIGHQHVRSTAQHRHRHAGRARQFERRHQLVAAPRLDQPFRRAADLERRERRQRHVRPQAIGAERLLHGGDEPVHCRPISNTINARSCAISAAIASRGVQTEKAMVSPGPSCPATAMSAEITVAIFGYPPVV